MVPLAALAAVVVASSPAGLSTTAPTAATTPTAPDWEFWAGLSPGLRPDTGSAAATGRIGLSRKWGRHLRPELELGTGAHIGDQQAVGLMRLGTRVEFGGGRVVPWLLFSFAHQHEMAFADAGHNPIGGVLGLSGNGEIHRSGLDVGAGLTLNLPRAPRDPHQFRLLARASVVQLLGQGPPRSVDLLLAVGVGF